MKALTIRATSRISTSINKTYYTFEYCEERQIEDGDDVVAERKKLWETCNAEVDNQVSSVFEMYKAKR